MTLTDDTLDALSAAGGVQLQRAGDETVTSGRIEVSLAAPDNWFDPVLPDLMPSSPRGDYRERTVNLLVRDAISNPVGLEEERLFERESKFGTGSFFDDGAIASEEMRLVFGEILADHYVVETTRRSKFLFPFQSDLPGNYRFNGRYKMFNGLILAFFAKPGADGTGFNRQLLDAFYDLFNDSTELSLLEQQALRIARAVASENGGAEGRNASAQVLLENHEKRLADEVYFPEAHKLIQEDLDRALRMESLGRKDRVNAVVQVFYLHLALYFWRAGFVLDEQAGLFLRFVAGEHDALASLEEAARSGLEDSPFRGQVRFRVAAARPRPVSRRDGCAESFQEVNDRRLLLLPVNLSLLQASRAFLGEGHSTATFASLAAALDADEALQREFDCACRIAAASVATLLEGKHQDDILRLAQDPAQPGFLALRDALLKKWRRELRRSSTDITAQLMRRGGRGISAVRGPVRFFELGQDMLLLLAKLVAGDESVRYREFLDRLSLYGLAPQDRDEEALLADVLRSLQLLEKFSDTGEAMYVKHFL